LILLEKKIPLKLSKDISKKINYLCQVIPNVEWSGVLFYTTTGSIKNKSLKIKVEDILPMDKGTTGFTSFAMDNRVIDYLIDNNAVDKKLKMGLIHSHHNMEAFFSGEDDDELCDGAYTNNIYVSLIVNNRGKRVARIAYAGIPASKMTSRDEKGDVYTLNLNENVIIPDALKPVLYHECDVQEEIVTLDLPKDFLKAVQNILIRPSFESTKIAKANSQYFNSFKKENASWEDTPKLFPKTFPLKNSNEESEEKIFDLLVDFADKSNFTISESHYLETFHPTSFYKLFIDLEENWKSVENKEEVVEIFYNNIIEYSEEFESMKEILYFLNLLQIELKKRVHLQIGKHLSTILQNFIIKLSKKNDNGKQLPKV
jgi:proteasome lid subunit RPN8/RPN11